MKNTQSRTVLFDKLHPSSLEKLRILERVGRQANTPANSRNDYLDCSDEQFAQNYLLEAIYSTNTDYSQMKIPLHRLFESHPKLLSEQIRSNVLTIFFKGVKTFTNGATTRDAQFWLRFLDWREFLRMLPMQLLQKLRSSSYADASEYLKQNIPSMTRKARAMYLNVVGHCLGLWKPTDYDPLLDLRSGRTLVRMGLATHIIHSENPTHVRVTDTLNDGGFKAMIDISRANGLDLGYIDDASYQHAESCTDENPCESCELPQYTTTGTY